VLPTDPLPALVRAFVDDPAGPAAAPLLAEVQRQVRGVCRPYPDAYFTLGRKDDEGLTDLSHRVFTVCARVEKGRFPFLGRPPFRAYAEERFDGRAVRYHSFYARLSVTRELLRDEYARNLTRDPALRAKAERYAQVVEALQAVGEPLPRPEGGPPRWAPKGEGPRLLRGPAALRARLAAACPAPVGALAALALAEGGPASAAQILALIDEVQPPDAVLDATPAAGGEGLDLPARLAVRAAVRGAWAALGDEERALLVAIAAGEDYDSLVRRDPRFGHKSAVTRALKRCGDRFVGRVLEAMGLPAQESASPPKAVVEAVMEVLEELIPSAGADVGGAR
jgi:hypothetical protein